MTIAPSKNLSQIIRVGESATRPRVKSAVSLYEFSPASIVHPTTEEEIAQVVQAAAQQNLKVRAIGSLHSLAPIPATDGVCIVLDQYRKLLGIDGTRVTVQAGMKLWELNDILAQHGLALPVLGTIALQTVSGAISTGTHGGSLHHPCLSGYVQALRIVRADGSVVALDRTHELFHAAVISMGMLGIVSTVTIQCVPAFSLQTEVRSLPMKTFLQQFDRIQRTHQYVDMRYSPITDTVQLALINPPVKPILENGGWYPTVKDRRAWKRSDFVNKLGVRLFNTHRLNWLQRWCLRQYESTVYSSPYGRSDFVLTYFDASSIDFVQTCLRPTQYDPTQNTDGEDFDPVEDMELAIPYDQAQAALACLREHFQQTCRFPSLQIHLRCTAADEFWLSPAYGQAVCWLEFWEYPRTGAFLQEMVDLLKPFRFRGHWGKQIPVESHYLQQQYEKWHTFLELRQTWDPDRRFANACLNRYFAL